MNNDNQLKNVTITIIFDGAALNRDEKIGGNILSVKKLNVNGQERTFISKPAIRHYLFETLHKAFKWKPAEVLKGSDVIQFDLFQKDVLTSKELDAFGYMYTISGSNSLTRKSPVGITKAISISPFEQDMAFYGNHDLVSRANKAGNKTNPNPYNKEEHCSLYKLSFTIDVDRLGIDEWVVKNCHSIDSQLKIEIETPYAQELTGITKNAENEDYYTLDKHKIYKEGLIVKVPAAIVKEDNNTIKFNKIKDKITPAKGFSIDDYQKETIEIDDKKIDYYVFNLNEEAKYNSGKENLILTSGAVKYISFSAEKEENSKKIYSTKNGVVIVEEINKKGPYKVKFILSEDKKKERINELLSAIHNGLYAQSSGEANTITPLVTMAAPVEIPSPIFHSYLDLKLDENPPKVIGIYDAFNNSWIRGKVFIKGTDRIPIKDLKFGGSKYTNDWSEFLKEIGIKSNENE